VSERSTKDADAVSDPLALALPTELVEAIAARAAELVLAQLGERLDEWLSSEQAADYLGISVGHLHNLKGRVPSHKVGGRRRYRRSELDAYQRQGS
jgi:excisionase family DNA binding protein